MFEGFDPAQTDNYVAFFKALIYNPLSGFLFCLFLVVKYPEKLSYILSNAASAVKTISSAFEKIYIKHDLQYKLNTYTKKMFGELKAKGWRALHLKFVKTTTPETFFKENKVIIRMSCDENQSRNLCIATLTYVSNALIRQTKKFLTPNLREAIDLMFVKDIFDAYGSDDERHFFEDDILFPKCDQSKALDDCCGKINSIASKGYFTRLFLRELYFLGPRLKSDWPTETISKEIEEFLDYIQALAKTPIVESPGEFLEPDKFTYKGRYIRARVVLFANPAKMEHRSGVEPYLARIREGLRDGANVFYILGHEGSIDFIRQFQKEVHQRLVKTNILKRMTDRVYKIPSGGRKGEKHLCLIYRKQDILKQHDYESLFKEIDEIDLEGHGLSGEDGSVERRQFERISRQLEADYKIIQRVGRQGVETGKCVISDISFGGLRIAHALDQKTLVDVTFKEPHTNQLIKCRGDVVWTNLDTNESGVEFRKFNKARQNHLERLSEYINWEFSQSSFQVENNPASLPDVPRATL